MKRQQFRLGSVLRYYALQKQRSEYEVRRASQVLQEAEAEIDALNVDIMTVASLLQGDAAAGLTISGWIACYRKAERLDKLLTAARERCQKQAALVAQLEGQRKRWAQAEETLLSLRRALEESNKTEAAKAQQLVLDDAVLRRWLDQDH